MWQAAWIFASKAIYLKLTDLATQEAKMVSFSAVRYFCIGHYNLHGIFLYSFNLYCIAGRMAMADVLCHMKEKALKEVNPMIFTWATLTGHVIIAHGDKYSVRH